MSGDESVRDVCRTNHASQIVITGQRAQEQAPHAQRDRMPDGQRLAGGSYSEVCKWNKLNFGASV